MNKLNKKNMIIQYTTSIEVNLDLLSEDQKEIREKLQNNSKEEMKRCKKCAILKPIGSFRVRKFRHGKEGLFYDASCKDCHARVRGTKEIGKNRFSKKILEKGFKRCTKCKNIKLISDFYKNKAHPTGLANNCKECNYVKKTKSLI